MTKGADLSKLADELRAVFDAADTAHKAAGQKLDELRESVAHIEFAVEAQGGAQKAKSKPPGARQALFYAAIYVAGGDASDAARASESAVRNALGTLTLAGKGFAYGQLWSSAKARLGEDFDVAGDGSLKIKASGVAAIRANLDEIAGIPPAIFAELSANPH